ncbi:MAG: putative oxidoreductase [Ilumatobacteraceae bacterium]|nr:putative oxidoreductase [Ilumatobacteraceae bacterium]
MRAVLIVAHPDPGSYTHAIATRVAEGLIAAGHQVIVHDLYTEGFAAAMSADERHAYHGDQPVLDPLVAEHIADITAAHTLIYVYPTWWSGLPAILKGWFERVMVPGVGFVFDAKGKVRPGLTNVRRLVGISTYGSRWAYVKAINDNGRRTIMRAMRLSTGIRTRSRWLALYGMDSSTAADRQSFLDRCEHLARSL